MEYTGPTNDPRVARIIKYLGQATAHNPDLFHSMIMEDLMEAEAQRDKKRLEDAENAKIEAEKRSIDAEKAKNEADLKLDFLEKENERLRQELQNKQ